MPEPVEFTQQSEQECAGGRILIQTDAAWMKAALSLYPSASGELFEPTDVAAALAAAQVARGVDDAALEAAIAEANGSRQPVEWRIVAAGRPPQPSVDAYLEFPPLRRYAPGGLLHPGAMEYTRARIVNVNAGETVAIYHPLEDGLPGVTVRGAYVPSEPAIDRTPRTGRGVRREADRMVATTDGRLLVEEREVNVDGNLRIEGNLTLLAGDIDFVGHITVLGDIEPGLRVRGRKNITVGGSIFDSSIICAGNLSVKHGIVGGGDAVVEVHGKLEADFVENMEIKVWGDCQISKSIVNSRVLCARALSMPGYGHFVSGQLYASDGIHLAQVGLSKGGSVKLTVGIDALAAQRVLEIDAELDAIEERVRKIREVLAELGPETRVYAALSGARRAEIDRLGEALVQLESQMKPLHEERERVMQQTKKNHEATVSIRGFVHSDAVIQFPLDRLVVRQYTKRVTYSFDLHEMKIKTQGVAA
jgi:uncharacterized protein (DUF342 family)